MTTDLTILITQDGRAITPITFMSFVNAERMRAALAERHPDSEWEVLAVFPG